MPEDELEPRLRRMLTARAGGLRAQLDGATLRARAADRPRAVRKLVAPVLLAAAIVLLALAPTLFSGSDNHRRHTVPPGSVSVTVTVPAPSPTSTRPPSLPVIAPTTPPSPTISMPIAPGSASSAPIAPSSLPSASVLTRLPSASTTAR